MVQMSAFADRLPAQLSGGQQQRIALARALVFKPTLVLMDEPLGALDKQLREHMQLELKALHQSLGVTFVYVTHDQTEALTMSDRVAVFDQGIIQQVAHVSTLYESPSNRFVAGFVSDCNQLHGTVLASKDDTCTVRLPDGTELSTLNVNGLAPNTPCIVAIRPERIRLTEAGQPNSIAAKALDTVYFGDHVRLRCQVADSPSVFIKVPLSDSAAIETLGRDAPIHLQVAPQYARTFSP